MFIDLKKVKRLPCKVYVYGFVDLHIKQRWDIYIMSCMEKDVYI